MIEEERAIICAVRRTTGFSLDDLTFVHIDVKRLPGLRTADGEIRKRFLYVVIDRCSRFVHLNV